VSAADELELAASDGGVTFAVRVSAGASRTRVLGVLGGTLKLAVQAPPERGKANREVLRIVGETFELAPSLVTIVRGETSPDKTLKLPLGREEAAARWERARGRLSASARPAKRRTP
jgi:uncharacterized protein (TIGR00251 family)